MDFESIKEMWEKDSKMDEFSLDMESLKIPQLHQKYYTLLCEFNLLKRKSELELKTLTKEKWKYYKGKASKEIYKEIPFDLKLTTKEEISMFIEADEDIQRYILKISYTEEIINYLDSILKMVSNRTYQIKNAIEHRRFEAGG